MEHIANSNKNISKVLTNKRFNLGYLETQIRLQELKKKGGISDREFEDIYNRDLLLKIKFKTYKKSLRNLTISIILIIIGLGPANILSFRYLIIASGIILSISSISGILSNKLSKNQKEYIKK